MNPKDFIQQQATYFVARVLIAHDWQDAFGIVKYADEFGGFTNTGEVRLTFDAAVRAKEIAMEKYGHFIDDITIFPAQDQTQMFWQGRRWPEDFNESELLVALESEERDFIMQQRVPYVVRVKYQLGEVPESSWHYLDADGQFYLANVFKEGGKQKSLMRFDNTADASRVYEINVRRQRKDKELTPSKVEFVPIHMMEGQEEKDFIARQEVPWVIRMRYSHQDEDKWQFYCMDGFHYPPNWDRNVVKFPTEAAAKQRVFDLGQPGGSEQIIEVVPINMMPAVEESSKDTLIGSVCAVYKNKVALVKGKHGWTLPGGRAEEEESVFHAAARECGEECSVSVKPADLIFVGMVQRSKHRIDSIFVVELEKEQAAKAGSDAEEAMWVSLDNLPNLGFGHAAAIKKALRVLRMKPEERGQLIVFEGVDGAGKTTQVERTIEWLKKHGFPVITTKWASSPLIASAIKKGKKKRELSPVLYHLMHSADLLHRYEQIVCPALARNFVVVCDRYWPTGVVRDRLRGVKNKSCYAKLRKPDVLFYCAVKPEIAVKRLMKAGRLSWYGIGMDIAYADDEQENAQEYSKRMARLYQRVLPARHVALHMDRRVDKIWDDVKAKLQKVLDDHYYRGQNLMERAAFIACCLLETSVDVRDFIGSQEPLYVIHATHLRDGRKLYWALSGWQPDKLKADAFYGGDAELWMRHGQNLQDAMTQPYLKDFGIEVAEKPFDPMEKYRNHPLAKRLMGENFVKDFINRQAVIYNITGTRTRTGEKVMWTFGHSWETPAIIAIGAHPKWRGGANSAEQWVKMLQFEQDNYAPAVADIHFEAELKEAIDPKEFMDQTNKASLAVVSAKLKELGFEPVQSDDMWDEVLLDDMVEAAWRKTYVYTNKGIQYTGVYRFLLNGNKAAACDSYSGLFIDATVFATGFPEDVLAKMVQRMQRQSVKEAIDPRQEILSGKNRWELRVRTAVEAKAQRSWPQSKDHTIVDIYCNGEHVGLYEVDNKMAPVDKRLLQYWKDQIEALDEHDQFHSLEWPGHGIWEWLMKHNLRLDQPGRTTADVVYAQDRRARLKQLGWIKEAEAKDFIMQQPVLYMVTGHDRHGSKFYLSDLPPRMRCKLGWVQHAQDANVYTAEEAHKLVEWYKRVLNTPSAWVKDFMAEPIDAPDTHGMDVTVLDSLVKEGMEKDFIVTNEPNTFRIGGTDDEGTRRYLTSQRVRDGDWTSDVTKASLYTAEEAAATVADIVRLGTWLTDIRSEPVDHDDPLAGYWRWNPESMDPKDFILGVKPARYRIHAFSSTTGRPMWLRRAGERLAFTYRREEGVAYPAAIADENLTKVRLRLSWLKGVRLEIVDS